MERGRARGRMNQPLGPVHKGSAQNGSIYEAKPLSAKAHSQNLLEWPLSGRDPGLFLRSSIHSAGCVLCHVRVQRGAEQMGGPRPLGLPACR